MVYFEVLYLHLLENLRKITKLLANAADPPNRKQNLGTPKYAAGVSITVCTPVPAFQAQLIL